MEEVKLTKEQEIIFEVYDKGVQNEDCDLNAYVEKMKQALSITDVSQQRELLNLFRNKLNHALEIDIGFDYITDEDIEDCINEFNGG